MMVTMVMTSFFTNFARCELNYGIMTQKEATVKALKDLGGRAKLPDIYLHVVKLLEKKSISEIEAPVRGLLQRDKLLFRRPPDKPTGWYELTSYQEEVAAIKKENEELKESNKRLTSIPKEAEFIEKFLDEVMDVYKYDRKKADPIRIIMRTLGHEEAVAVLTAWIDEKEDELAKALEKLKIQIRNITMTGNDATYNENNDKDK
jgi:hypothetical protein